MTTVKNYKDFDEFFQEVEAKPVIRIKMFGKDYDLPSELPAMTLLETYRAFKSGETTVSDAKQMEIAMTMLGENNVTEWCEKGLTMSQLTEVMKWVAAQHQVKGEVKGKK
jgi:isopentenyl diphosphate isomerase/L-lactate dehydrogenase-like FMN-dependent dehydrogenase